MPTPPESTKISLRQRLRAHASTHWPQLAGLHFRYRGGFAYIDGELGDGQILPLIRLRYGGSASIWAPPPRTKTSGCRSQGGLPDPACTPGAVDSRVSESNVSSTIFS